MIPCSFQGILWFEGQVKVTAIRFSPASLSDRCEFEQRLRDYEISMKIVDIPID
jgi:hypothetical protein